MRKNVPKIPGINILMKNNSKDELSAAACGMLKDENNIIELASRIPRSPSEIGKSDFTNIIALVPMKA